MARTAAGTPKFRITAKRFVQSGEYKRMPYVQDLADTQSEALVKAAFLQNDDPSALVEIMLQCGFSHGRPMRWTYDDTNKRIKPTVHYDKTMGTPTLEAVLAEKKEPTDGIAVTENR